MNARAEAAQWHSQFRGRNEKYVSLSLSVSFYFFLHISFDYIRLSWYIYTQVDIHFFRFSAHTYKHAIFRISWWRSLAVAYQLLISIQLWLFLTIFTASVFVANDGTLLLNHILQYMCRRDLCSCVRKYAT